MRARDEVQQEQASTDERVTDESRQHHAKQERRPGDERYAYPCRTRAAPGPGSCRSHHSACVLRSLARYA